MQDNFKEKFLMGLKADMFFKQMFGFNLDLSGGYLINASEKFKFGPKVDVTLFGIANKNMTPSTHGPDRRGPDRQT